MESPAIAVLLLLLLLSQVRNAAGQTGRNENRTQLVEIDDIGESVTLNCTRYRDIPATFNFWLLPDLTIVDKSYHGNQVELVDDWSLYIHKVKEDHLGDYLCNVKDENASYFYKTILQVYMPSLWELHRMNTIIGLSAAAIFLALCITLCCIYAYSWETKTTRKMRKSHSYPVPVEMVTMDSEPDGVPVIVTGYERKRGSYDPPIVVDEGHENVTLEEDDKGEDDKEKMNIVVLNNNASKAIEDNPENCESEADDSENPADEVTANANNAVVEVPLEDADEDAAREEGSLDDFGARHDEAYDDDLPDTIAEVDVEEDPVWYEANQNDKDDAEKYDEFKGHTDESLRRISSPDVMIQYSEDDLNKSHNNNTQF